MVAGGDGFQETAVLSPEVFCSGRTRCRHGHIAEALSQCVRHRYFDLDIVVQPEQLLVDALLV
jgi:hypothetical protein